MANWFGEWDSTPTTILADLKSRILNSSDWANIAGGTGSVMSATTTRGAQMAVDLADAAVSSRQLQIGVYRTYSGTGTDKLVRYLCWKDGGTATMTDVIHCMLSVGKDHLFIALEGPRPGEVNAQSVADGTPRQCFFLGDLVPYVAGEPNPVVVLLANTSNASTQTTELVWVSRNRANTSSWVPARLVSLCQPNVNTNAAFVSPIRYCQADGNTYIWPYVVIEEVAGLRGRLGKAFLVGWYTQSIGQTAADAPPAVYTRVTYNAETYIYVQPHRQLGGAGIQSRSALGWSNYSGAPSPIIAVPTQ
jgi:hypothetical protein